MRMRMMTMMMGRRRRKRLRSAESVESGLGDEPEAGIGADEVRLANEIGAMIKIDSMHCAVSTSIKDPTEFL